MIAERFIPGAVVREVDRIVLAVADRHGQTVEQLLTSRQREAVVARRIAIYLANHRLSWCSKRTIAEAFGQQSGHVTVIAAVRDVQHLMATDAIIREEVRSLLTQLHATAS